MNHYIGQKDTHDTVVFTGTDTYNACPHIDFFQTFSDGSPNGTANIVFEGNLGRNSNIYNITQGCHLPGTGTSNCGSSTCTGVNHFGNIEDTDTGNLTFKNNVFVNALQGMDFVSGSAAVQWENNTSDSTTNQQLIFHVTPPSGTVVENDIFHDIQLTAWWSGTQTGVTFATNWYGWRSGGGYVSPGGNAAASTTTFTSGNAKFVSNGTSPGFSDANYHLQVTSQAKNGGTTIAGVPVDYDGVSRPQNTTYSIGAFEVTPPLSRAATSGSALAATSVTCAKPAGLQVGDSMFAAISQRVTGSATI